jgi:hypothetical protein
MDPFKGKMQRLIVGKTPAFEVDKFMTDVDQYAFSLKGEGDTGMGTYSFGQTGRRNTKRERASPKCRKSWRSRS